MNVNILALMRSGMMAVPLLLWTLFSPHIAEGS